MIAAERLGRRARLVELDPKYADVAVQRWQMYASGQATLDDAGKTFAEEAARRRPPTDSHADVAGVQQ
jgi:hypothetical protein